MTVLSLSSMVNALAKYNKRRERYQDSDPFSGPSPLSPDDAKELFGLTIGVFLVLLLIMIVLWIWALMILVKNWKTLPDWARVIGVLGVIPAVPVGPLVTIIIVYIAKGSRKN